MMEQDIMQEFKNLESSSVFISKKSKEISNKYTKKFIAVYENKIIAVGETFREVMKKIKGMEINPSLVLIEYIHGKEEIILY